MNGSKITGAVLRLTGISSVCLCCGSASANDLYLCSQKVSGDLRETSAPGQCNPSEVEHVLTTISDEDKQALAALQQEVEVMKAYFGLINEPPSVWVSASLDRVTVDMTPVLSGKISDDGLLEPVQFEWTQSGDQPATIVSPNNLTTDVLFSPTSDPSGMEVYEFTLTATDGQYESSNYVQVTVFNENDPPTIDALVVERAKAGALSPATGECLIEVSYDITDDGVLRPIKPTVDLTAIDGRFVDERSKFVSNTSTQIHVQYPIENSDPAIDFDFTLRVSDGQNSVSRSTTINCR